MKKTLKIIIPIILIVSITLPLSGCVWKNIADLLRQNDETEEISTVLTQSRFTELVMEYITNKDADGLIKYVLLGYA